MYGLEPRTVHPVIGRKDGPSIQKMVDIRKPWRQRGRLVTEKDGDTWGKSRSESVGASSWDEVVVPPYCRVMMRINQQSVTAWQQAASVRTEGNK